MFLPFLFLSFPVCRGGGVAVCGEDGWVGARQTAPDSPGAGGATCLPSLLIIAHHCHHCIILGFRLVSPRSRGSDAW